MSKKYYSVDEVLNAYKYCSKHIEGGILYLNNKKIQINRQIRLFAEKGIKCDCCGIKGEFFEIYKEDKKYHLRLLTYKLGVHLTIEHNISKCIGGTNDISNLIPLCNYCNNVFVSKFDRNLKQKVVGISVKRDAYLMII